jgi:hypothetical protein
MLHLAAEGKQQQQQQQQQQRAKVTKRGLVLYGSLFLPLDQAASSSSC